MTRPIIFSIVLLLFSCQSNKNSRHLAWRISPTETTNLVADTTLRDSLKKSKPLNKTINSVEKIKSGSDTPLWDSLKNSTVLSFIEKVSNKADIKELNFITIEDDGTTNNWIKQKDVDTLIALIKSKKHCQCVVDPLSSYLPTNDYAELGGYAILLLKQYRDKKNIRFSLYACPKTNEKDADELIKWWTENKM